MNRTALKTAAKNLALLALIVMPFFFVLLWLQSLLRVGVGPAGLGQILETGGFYYLANVMPVLIGGLIHQVVWLLLPEGWNGVRRRILAFLSAPVIPAAVWLFWLGPMRSLLHFVAPMTLALAAYVLSMRSPTASDRAA